MTGVRVPGHRLVPAVLAVALGMIISVQSRVNGELSRELGTGLIPSWLTMATGTTILVAVVSLHPQSRRGLAEVIRQVARGSLPRGVLIGGIFGSLFLITQSVTVPIVGVAVFTVGVVAGQTTGSLVVDRLGLSGTGKRAVTGRRVGSAVLAILAVGIGVSDRLQSAPAAIAYAGFALVAGALIAPQQAVNGRVAIVARSPFVAAFVNFVGGALVLTVVLTIARLSGHLDPRDPFGAPWWAYVGGVLGVTVIAGAAWVVPGLGVLVFSLLSVLGQLAGALVLDVIAPTPGASLGWHLITGLVLTFVAVVIAYAPRSRVN